jgi:hypothetical protein
MEHVLAGNLLPAGKLLAHQDDEKEFFLLHLIAEMAVAFQAERIMTSHAKLIPRHGRREKVDSKRN